MGSSYQFNSLALQTKLLSLQQTISELKQKLVASNFKIETTIGKEENISEMEASPEEQSVDHELYWESKISQEFFRFLKLEENSEEENGEHEEEEEDGEHEEEEEEEFSFVFGGETESSIAAEDAFTDGRIKAVFPLFNRDLVFHDGGDSDSDSLPENLRTDSPVKKVFVETGDINGEMTSSAPENDGIAGPYCDWSSRQAVEVSTSTEVKKSNSTGFSRIWRFKEFRERCNSDGRDAFVFLNKCHAPPKQKTPAKAPTEETAKDAGKVKKAGNKKKVSAHEVYLMSKAKDGRRRTYLPYRPELMGFFTNVSSGGLTRNVHPY